MRPTDEEMESGARSLWADGASHGWWPKSCDSYDALDPIGKQEFDGIVERILMAASAAKARPSLT